MLAIVALTSCSSTKKVAKQDDSKNDNVQATILTEDKKMEFEFMFVEGLKQKIVGNSEKARQYFNGCLEINPNSAATMFEIANIYVQKGDFVGAKLLLEKAVQIDESNKWYKLLLAQIYQREQNLEKASEVYKALIANDPDNIEYYYLNAILLSSGGEYEKAIEAYNQLEKVSGYTPEIAIARQQVYRQAGKNKEAYAELQRLINSNPSIPEYYGIMADMYKDDNNMEKALEYYNLVLEKDPNNGFVHFSLASYYIQNKQADEAFSHAYTGFSNPDIDIDTKIQLYLMLVTAPSDHKLSNEQMDKLTLVISDTHPADSRSFSIRADYLIQSDRKKEARDFIAQAIENSPNNYSLWEQLIMLDNDLEDFSQMVSDAGRTIELFPIQPFPYLLKAVAHIQLEEYQKAIDIIESGVPYVIDNNKMETQFEMNKAEAYYNLGKKKEAFESFEKVLKLDPSNYMAMNNYAYFLAESNENLDRAEILSSQVVKEHPDNPTYVDTHAWVLFKKGEYRLAKFYIETVVKNKTSESDVIVEHYGDILYKMNDVDGAVAAWEKAAEMGNQSTILKKKIADRKYIEEEK